VDGKLTEAGWQALATFPYLNRAKLAGPEVQQYLYSLEMLVDYLDFRLKEAA
jgi:hypothetical protein